MFSLKSQKISLRKRINDKSQSNKAQAQRNRKSCSNGTNRVTTIFHNKTKLLQLSFSSFYKAFCNNTNTMLVINNKKSA